MLPAVYPGTTDGDPFAGADLGCMAHHRDQIAMAAGFDAKHAEAALSAVEGDPLDRSGQYFSGLGCGVWLPGGLASDRLVHASSQDHWAMLTGCCNAHPSGDALKATWVK